MPTATTDDWKHFKTLSSLEPGLIMANVAGKLNVSMKKARMLCKQAGYDYMENRGSKNQILTNPKRRKHYQRFKWSLGISRLQKKHKISRETLSNVRQMLDFWKLFRHRKTLSHAECVKEMKGLQQFRKSRSAERRGAAFEPLKHMEFNGYCRALKIRTVK